MGFISLVGSKVLLAICNFLLLACGFSLITGGLLLLFDGDRILLSRLLTNGPLSTMPQPLLYYMAIGLTGVGLILASTGILGCWASCMHSYYMLTAYFLIIIMALVVECAIYIIAWAWPGCLGLGVDETDLTKTLQRNYGTIGQEQFTAAIDLAQTWFNCCGIESANEYDTSLWRLQALGPSLAVPLTCCKLENYHLPRAYLNPNPINSSLCQALEVNRHEGYRHLPGCNDYLQQWYREHYLMFLGIGLIAVLVEFLVLLSTILTCTRIYKYKQDTKENAKNSSSSSSKQHQQEHHQQQVDNQDIGNIPTIIKTGSSNNGSILQYHSQLNKSPVVIDGYSNDTYAMTNSFRQNYKLVDRV